jgi:hypothetical protein
MARRACLLLYLLPPAVFAGWLYDGFVDRGGLELAGAAFIAHKTLEEPPERAQTVSSEAAGADEEAFMRAWAPPWARGGNATHTRARGGSGTCGARARGGGGAVLRLTPASPSVSGAAWSSARVFAASGFTTGFTFALREASRSCVRVRERSLSALTYAACAATGGDGFAFVLRGEAAAAAGAGTAAALGAGASGLGYAGLRDALVVAFDTFFNAELGDLPTEFVSVRGPVTRGGSVGAGAAWRLAPARAAALADGRPHVVRLRYHASLAAATRAGGALAGAQLAAAPALAPLLVDAGGAARLGALELHVDDLDGPPMLVLPINLPVLLAAPRGRAVAGFTAATGRAWQAHDIERWYWREGAPAAP